MAGLADLVDEAEEGQFITEGVFEGFSKSDGVGRWAGRDGALAGAAFETTCLVELVALGLGVAELVNGGLGGDDETIVDEAVSAYATGADGLAPEAHEAGRDEW